MIKIEQKRKINRILKRANKEFKDMSKEVGLNKEIDELSSEEARLFLKHYGVYLIIGKSKQ